MTVLIVIPARYGSQRLPAKALADIAGKPMIQWTYERARLAADELQCQVCVATDDERIANVVRSFGGQVEMTPVECPSGTDRMAALLHRNPAEVWVNLQGDEPAMEPENIVQAVKGVSEAGFDIASLCTDLLPGELEKNSCVKAWMVNDGSAKCFSRQSRPYDQGLGLSHSLLGPYRHLGIYVYRRSALERFTQEYLSELERKWEIQEKLEQLRAFALGLRLGLRRVQSRGFGVDTAEDLDKVRDLLV